MNGMRWVLHPPKAPEEDEAPCHPLSACPLNALRHHFQLPVVWPFWIQTELLHLLLKSALDGCVPTTPPKVASSCLTWSCPPPTPVHHLHPKQVKSSRVNRHEMLRCLNSLPATWLHLQPCCHRQHGLWPNSGVCKLAVGGRLRHNIAQSTVPIHRQVEEHSKCTLLLVLEVCIACALCAL